MKMAMNRNEKINGGTGLAKTSIKDVDDQKNVSIVRGREKKFIFSNRSFTRRLQLEWEEHTFFDSL